MDKSHMFAAVEKGDLVMLRQLLQGDVSADVKNDNGATLLFEAAEKGFLDIVQFLIERGSNPNLADKYDDVPINRAAVHGHLEIVRFLAEKGALVHSPGIGLMPLLTAASNGHLAVVKYLVEERGAKVNDMSRHMGSPLQAAACNGHLDVVRYLREKGADPYLRDSMGQNAISMVQECLKMDSISPEEKMKYNTILEYLHSEGILPKELIDHVQQVESIESTQTDKSVFIPCQLGKIYKCEICGTEVICIKAGKGQTTCCGKQVIPKH